MLLALGGPVRLTLLHVIFHDGGLVEKVGLVLMLLGGAGNMGHGAYARYIVHAAVDVLKRRRRAGSRMLDRLVLLLWVLQDDVVVARLHG